MRSDSTQPRPRGTGSLLRHASRSGDQSWYGKWRVEGGAQVMAEAAFRRAIADRDLSKPDRTNGMTVGLAGQRLLDRLAALGRKRSTLMDYESTLRVHLVPFFGERPLSAIDVELVELFIESKQQEARPRNRFRTTPASSVRSSATRRSAAGAAETRSLSLTSRLRLKVPTFASSPSTSSTRSWRRCRKPTSAALIASSSSPQR